MKNQILKKSLRALALAFLSVALLSPGSYANPQKGKKTRVKRSPELLKESQKFAVASRAANESLKSLGEAMRRATR